jgi:hypothetical protein
MSSWTRKPKIPKPKPLEPEKEKEEPPIVQPTLFPKPDTFTIGIGYLYDPPSIESQHTTFVSRHKDPVQAKNECLQALEAHDYIFLLNKHHNEDELQSILQTSRDASYQFLFKHDLWFLTRDCISKCGGFRTDEEEYAKRAHAANLVPNPFCKLETLPTTANVATEPQQDPSFRLYTSTTPILTWVRPDDNVRILEHWISKQTTLTIVFSQEPRNSTHLVKYIRTQDSRWQQILEFYLDNRAYIEGVHIVNFEACLHVPTTTTNTLRIAKLGSNSDPTIYTYLPKDQIIPFCTLMHHTPTSFTEFPYEPLDCTPICVSTQDSPHALLFMEGPELHTDRLLQVPTRQDVLLWAKSQNRGIFFTQEPITEKVQTIVHSKPSCWTSNPSDLWQALCLSATALDSLIIHDPIDEQIQAILKPSKPTSIKQTNHYFLFYYDEDISAYKQPYITPIPLQANHPTLFESRGFFQITDLPNVDNIGFLTPSFLKKTRIPLHELRNIELEEHTICGFIWNGTEKNCLAQAKTSHGPVFQKLWNRILELLGYVHLIGKDFLCSYCNMWLANRTIVENYLVFIQRVMTTMLEFTGHWKTLLESNSKYPGKLVLNNQIKTRTGFPHYTFHAFLAERMIGLFAMLKSYSYLEYRTKIKYKTAIVYTNAMNPALHPFEAFDEEAFLQNPLLYPNSLSYASYFGKSDLVANLLKQRQDELQINLATIFAIQTQNVEILRNLLPRANLEAYDWFHLAMEHPCPEILQEMLKNPRLVVYDDHDYLKFAIETSEDVANILVHDRRFLTDVRRIEDNFLLAAKHGQTSIVQFLSPLWLKGQIQPSILELREIFQTSLRTNPLLANILLKDRRIASDSLRAFYASQIQPYSQTRRYVQPSLTKTRKV